MLRHETREVRRRSECTAVDLGEAEDRVVGRDDDIGVSDEADAAADAEAVHGDDHGNLAVVDRGEGRGTTVVGGDEGVVTLGGLHFLDVDARVEASALGSEDHDVRLRVLTGGEDRVGQVEPRLRGEGVHRGEVDGDRGDTGAVGGRGDAHGMFLTSVPNQAIAW